ncbi:MAG: MiaB/RimO family radical SAM methylthiotransferase [Candidatus Dormibacteraceae bacterium]
MPRRSFHVWTIGCQMNLADSEALSRQLLAAGFQEERDLERADIAVLNTCVVRQASEDKVYSKLGELRAWKTPERTIAVTGCLVGKEGATLRGRFPHLDAVVPIGEGARFVADLEARYDLAQGEPLPETGRTGVSQFVSVIQGCDHNCTFCIVPKVRGREVMKPQSAVLQECRRAVAEGAREVVLLGQNVDDYRDPASGGGLSRLVEAVADLPGLLRVRFMTSHPQDLEPALLQVMAQNPKVAHELQLPIQSGDDYMLKRMARGYQVRHYRAQVEAARRLMPDLGLMTDVIVGFSGETRAMFEHTRDLLQEVEFDVVHLAQYSTRRGTYAADHWPDDVPPPEKRRRLGELLDLQRAIARRKAQRWIGRTVEILIEGADELGRPYGRTRQGKRTAVLGAQVGPRPGTPPTLPIAGRPPRSVVELGSLVEVTVEQATAGQLAGPRSGLSART